MGRRCALLPSLRRSSLLLRGRYAFDIDPARFSVPGIEAFYPGGDDHRAYIGEIVGCWRRA